jgi:hypothetical protein
VCQRTVCASALKRNVQFAIFFQLKQEDKNIRGLRPAGVASLESATNKLSLPGFSRRVYMEAVSRRKLRHRKRITFRISAKQ